MKLIGCDRCPGVFPCADGYTVVRLFDTQGDGVGLLAEPIEHHLCASCRAELDTFLTRHEPPEVPADRGEERVFKWPPDTRPAAIDLAEEYQRNLAAGQHTCEICGRTGKQRFTATPTGWRCSPTAYKCPGNRAERPRPEPEPDPDIAQEPQQLDPDPAPEPVTAAPDPEFAPRLEPMPPRLEPMPEPAEPALEPGVLPSGVTARCRDCPRSWNLTGRTLQAAIDLHEMKRGHIVDVSEGATA
jgi:hypothetical protein